ncbi:DUF1275 family protein [Streptomyces muensis]|uniref:DUF1275 domain-containing protein n=1 Tax=Streptomyces muensis TaxID=1077944 RepID=A0A9X1TIR2_STRM4|nr:DUF1275 family protein [Streptomyces muensis]MCF1592195.1 DUF1275 domain-containing protein [Streptomyces muensis]
MSVTGIVDAVAFLGLGQVFTAFMTGNILFLGFAVSGGAGLTPLGSLTALAAFAVGAVAGSRLGVATAARPRRWLRSATIWRLGAGLNTTLVTGTLVTLLLRAGLTAALAVAAAGCWPASGGYVAHPASRRTPSA